MNKLYRTLMWGAVWIAVFCPSIVLGHPLGNFSLNHYTLIQLKPGELITQHVLDLAEIPSYNELANLDVDSDNLVSEEEMEAYKRSFDKRYLPNYTFALAEEGGDPIALTPEIIAKNIVLSQGQGALTCLQLQLTCAIRHPILQRKGKKRFLFEDKIETYIRGIREIRIQDHPAVELKQEDITAQGPAAPVPISEDVYILMGLDVDASFTMTQNSAPPQERVIPNILSIMDPRSIPQFPISPDEKGNYKILKSPIQPDPEVQKQVAMLQPRVAISADGLLGGMSQAESEGEGAMTLPRIPTPAAGTESAYDRSGAKDAEWAALIGADELRPGIVLLALFVSIVAGASHALSPGHGKTVVAAYLVGSRGTVWHAVFLGIVVTMTHVSSVLLLGLITLFFSQYIVPEKLYPIIEGSSGLLIVIIGMTLFFRRYGAYQRKKILRSMGVAVEEAHHHGHSHPHEHEHDHEHPHAHAHDHEHPHPHEHEHEHPHEHPHTHENEHKHEHEQEHDHEHPHVHPPIHKSGRLEHKHGPHTHTHDIPADATLKELLVLGITGGIVPCPAAILVLLGAIALHRLLFGLLLIVFFSIGLASVLITIGVLMVTAKNLLDRFLKGEESFAWLQIASPILITLLGIVIFLRGLQTGGIITFNL
ncbi:MAG: hypothetical protein JXR73_04070 [Candidatus Omnitrophica bacterium]|nr:hypothetical protein [Candidatus Omnitrophota bacterium]